MSITFKEVEHIYSESTPFAYHALKGVNLDIKNGSFTAVIGQTGSGKSTLIQHINALLLPSSGNIEIDDYVITPANKPSGLKMLRKKAGLVFQFPEYQLFEETIEKDIIFGPINFGISEDEAKQIAKEVINIVGLDETYLDKSPFDLSGGQKRRVAIAGILAMNPDILILDEPTAGLDPVGKDQILNLLKKLHEEKKITIILVSHSMKDVADYAQRVIVMNHGQVMYEGDKKEVFSHKKELEAAGLAVPFYRQVCEELADRGFPIQRDLLTLEETKDAIIQGLKELRGK